MHSLCIGIIGCVVSLIRVTRPQVLMMCKTNSPLLQQFYTNAYHQKSFEWSSASCGTVMGLSTVAFRMICSYSFFFISEGWTEFSLVAFPPFRNLLEVLGYVLVTVTCSLFMAPNREEKPQLHLWNLLLGTLMHESSKSYCTRSGFCPSCCMNYLFISMGDRIFICISATAVAHLHISTPPPFSYFCMNAPACELRWPRWP